MELAGSDYLLRLSALAVSFVGFSAVIVALRRALGSELSPMHMYFIRFFIEGGLAVAAFGLLPAALSFTGLVDSAIWRLSSGMAALVFSVYFVILFRRRRRVTSAPIPGPARVTFVVSTLAALALWVNTVGWGFPPRAAPYTLALTALLVVGGWAFVRNLESFFGETRSG